MHTVIAELTSALSLHKPASRRLRAAGIVLLASGVLHLVAIVALGEQWAGPLSLRKAITFGLSLGILVWTIGWVIDQLPSRPRLERVLSIGMAVSAVVEVALITMQAWRGVPSHFNYGSVDGIVVFVAMGITIVVLSLGLLAVTVWAFRQPPVVPAVALAVRAGMLLILTGLGVGQWMIELGNDFYEQYDRVPDKMVSGAAGVPTFPHAMGFHAIQLFVLAALLTGMLGMAKREAQRVIRLVVAGYSLLLLWAILLAASGAAPTELVRPETLLVVVGVALLGTALVLLVQAWRAGTPARRAADPATNGSESARPPVPSGL